MGQTNDFYPFGLAAESFSRLSNIPNKFLYNAGAELNEISGNYETFYRHYDPVLGRFNSIDPLASSFTSLTPYQYANNDPVLYNDPLGDKFARQKEYTSWVTRRVGDITGNGGGAGGGPIMGRRNLAQEILGADLLGIIAENIAAMDKAQQEKKDDEEWADVVNDILANGLNSKYLKFEGNTSVVGEDLSFDWTGTDDWGLKFFERKPQSESEANFSGVLSLVDNVNSDIALFIGVGGVYIQTLLETAGNRGVGQAWERAAKTFEHIGGSVKIGPFITNSKALEKIGGYVGKAGKISGYLGLFTTGVKWLNGDVSGTEASIDGVFGVLGLIPEPVTTALSIVYFGGKLGLTEAGYDIWNWQVGAHGRVSNSKTGEVINIGVK